MLIVEGTDGIGKTTFCHKLVKRLQKQGPWIYSHFTKLPKIWSFPDSYKPHVRRFIVQDRFHMSEIVYRLARQESRMLSEEAYRQIDAWCGLVGVYTVILTADSATIKRGNHSKQMHSLTIAQRANDLFAEMPKHLFDKGWCTQNGLYPPDEFIDLIADEYLERQREQAAFEA